MSCEIGSEFRAHFLQVCGAAQAAIAQIGDRVLITREHPSVHERAPMNRILAAEPVIVGVWIGIARKRRVAILGKAQIAGSHAQSSLSAQWCGKKEEQSRSAKRPRSVTGVDHYLDPAVLLAPLRIVRAIRIRIRRDRPRFPVSFDSCRFRQKLVAHQPSLHRVGAPLAETLIVFGRADGIGMTFDRRWMIAEFGDLGAERAQSFLSIGIEIGFVETEERVGADIEAMLTSGILALDGVADVLETVTLAETMTTLVALLLR